MKMKNKTVLITGAALRIGRVLAHACADRGADLVLHYNRSGHAARTLQREIEAIGRKATLIHSDFSHTATGTTIRRLIQKLYRQVRHVDVLINNASLFSPVPFGKIRERDWDPMLTVNLKVPFFLAQAIGMRMQKRGSGKIINLVDCMILKPPVNYLPYVIAKAGLQAATIGLARALAPQVQVNSIAPGPILAARGMTAKQKKSVTQRTLLKRFGSPEDIAAAVLYLIEGSDYVTGTMLSVDGGSSIA